MHIVTVIGTRPQYIKVSSVSKKLREFHTEKLVDTGQHYDYNLSKSFYDVLNLPMADYNLNVGSFATPYQISVMMCKLAPVLEKEEPDAVMVYGDTNSTLVGALTASSMNIPVIHVEAGVRSFDFRMQEEKNRIVVDHLSTVLLCPTENALNRLYVENITNTSGKGVFNTGDVMVDTLYDNFEIALKNSNFIDQHGLYPRSYMVATIHRAENTNDRYRLSEILQAFEDLGEIVIFPMHPRTAKCIASYDLCVPDNVHVVEPLDYFDMLCVTNFAKKVITDSGGLQKEAYMMGVPCVTVRDSTEWIETYENNWNILVDCKKDEIVEACIKFPKKEPLNRSMFGDGKASDKIVKALNWFAVKMEKF